MIVGPERLPDDPPLLNKARDGFNLGLFDSEAEAKRLLVKVEPADGSWADPKFRKQQTRGGKIDAVVPVPADLKRRIERKEGFSFDIDYDSADEKSQITYLRLKEVLSHWKEGIVNRRLKQDKLPPSYTEPFKIRAVDSATPAEAGGTVWAKLFPFLLVMMSLTGAFYPAVDLCAGEKERGTMETLLISPASRAEIVMGKFLTILLASVMTALLNLICMGLTGMQLAQRSRRGGGQRRGWRWWWRNPRAAHAGIGLLDSVAAHSARLVLQRGLPGVGRSGAQHEGGAVLYDPSLSRLLAAHLLDAHPRH